MAKTYKFSVKINDNKSSMSPQKGVDIEDLGGLIQDMKKAIDPQDGSYCTMYKISNHGYTPNFLTNSKKVYENFISVHQNIFEKEFGDLRPKELKYAKTLKGMLRSGQFLESFGMRSKPIAKIVPSQINKPVESYSVITSVIGVISEIGAPNFNKKTHIFLDGFDYKIYTNSEQDEQLKEYYRSAAITLKVKQKRSLKSDRVISAALMNFYPKTKGNLIDNIEKLNEEDLNFMKNVDTHEDILKLIRL